MWFSTLVNSKPEQLIKLIDNHDYLEITDSEHSIVMSINILFTCFIKKLPKAIMRASLIDTSVLEAKV